MRGDVGSVAVRHRGRLERATGLVERAPQRRDRRRPARRGADLPARRRQGLAPFAGELDRVALAGIDDRAEKRATGGGIDGDDRWDGE